MTHKLNFRPESDGFAFGNSWIMEPNEQDRFPELMLEIFHRADHDLQEMFVQAARTTGAVVAVAGPFAGLAVGSVVSTGVGFAAGAAAGAAAGGFVGAAVGAALSFFGFWAATDPESLAKAALEKILPFVPSAGFCGGMAFATLDYYFAELVMPSGSAQPKASTTDDEREAWLRRYIFRRLVDSLLLNGYRFLHLQAFYNLGDSDDVNPIMRQVTQWACAQIIHEIDAGRPCGVGLVSTSIDPSKSHQIVCYGYNRPAENTIDLVVYDNIKHSQESIIRIIFSDQSAWILHPDRFVKWENDRFNTTGSNPSYCCLILLDYERQTPDPVLIVNSRLTANKSRVVLGSTLSFNAELLNRGFGAIPEGVLRFRQGSRFGLDYQPHQPSLEQGTTYAIAFSDQPVEAGSHTYVLDYRQWVQNLSVSVVERLDTWGLRPSLAGLCNPYIQDYVVRVINTQVSNKPPILPAGVFRPKRLTNVLGVSVSHTVRVDAPELFLDSPDIGNQCNPQSTPGKRVKILASSSPEQTPLTAATNYSWTVFDDAGSAWQTFTTTVPSIEILLPQAIGAQVSVTVVATYRNPPEKLEASLTITVVDQPTTALATHVCESLRKIIEDARSLKAWPRDWDPDWKLPDQRTSFETVMVNRAVKQARTIALSDSVELRKTLLNQQQEIGGQIGKQVHPIVTIRKRNSMKGLRDK